MWGASEFAWHSSEAQQIENMSRGVFQSNRGLMPVATFFHTTVGFSPGNKYWVTDTLNSYWPSSSSNFTAVISWLVDQLDKSSTDLVDQLS